jgi:hypothetical protein
MKGSDLLVSALENEGVERIFSVPGEENLDVVESLRRSSIKLIVTRHEQAAAFMAATHGRLTGRPGVCLATLGPGALNLTTGAAFALLGAMPMVMITGQKGILSCKQGRFQVVDIVATMGPLTKMARQIVSPATIPTTVREAFRLAQQERPGPVHLELPEDIAGEGVSEIPLVKLHPIDIPVADFAALDRAADLILPPDRRRKKPPRARHGAEAFGSTAGSRRSGRRVGIRTRRLSGASRTRRAVAPSHLRRDRRPISSTRRFPASDERLAATSPKSQTFAQKDRLNAFAPMCSRDACPSTASVTCCKASTSHVQQGPLIQGLLIGFFGSGLFFAVDKYEPDRTLVFVLKCLVVMWEAAAVIHCTGLFGAGFF